MKRQLLNGEWQFACIQDEESKREYLPVVIPGSVISGYLANDKIPDPHFGINEYEIRELFRKNYVFVKSFCLDEELRNSQKLELVCEGIDTLATVLVNGFHVGVADNMHSTWRFDIRPYLVDGNNEIRIIFDAPISYIENYRPEEGKEIRYIPAGGMKGNQYIRKAHSMFGWDWGPQLPDCGIWRDIYIEANDYGFMDTPHIMQQHRKLSEKETMVVIDINVPVTALQDGVFRVESEVYMPQVRPDQVKEAGLEPFGSELELLDEKERAYELTDGEEKEIYTALAVDRARLWWPNGLGNQPLYTVVIKLFYKNPQTQDEVLINEKSYRIGLRTVTVSQKKDEYGSEFALCVNGKTFFAMGADYIPEDTVYSRINREKIEKLIYSAYRSNFNTLRIWGGGYYPGEDFYDLCDEYGLCVWQDLMYACNIYDLTDNFEKSIRKETEDNVKRLRHHASLALWCGNNEIESAWSHWYNFCDHSMKLRADYLTMFEKILPSIIKAHDPEHFYWPSSPSSGGYFDNPDDDNRGDRHYWDVWHGQKPFSDYENYYFRFCSEFGFQSFPCLKTIESFTNPEDRNIFSRVMESHQKNDAANGKILYYLSENFLYPKDFENLLYVTQVLQGIAIKFGVEHWRRNRGRCMGALYWQLNDNWPVASWASIDYFGRWKGLQYMAKRFFAPKTVSMVNHDGKTELWIENETGQAALASIMCRIKTFDFKVIDTKTYSGSCDAFSAVKVCECDYSDKLTNRKGDVFLEYYATFMDGSKCRDVVFFEPYKYLSLPDTEINVKVTEEEDYYEIALSSEKFAAFVEIELLKADAVFSNNFFHITSESEISLKLLKSDIQGYEYSSAKELEADIKIKHLKNTYD